MYDYIIYQDTYEYFVDILYYSASTYIFHEAVPRHLCIYVLPTHLHGFYGKYLCYMVILPYISLLDIW